MSKKTLILTLLSAILLVACVVLIGENDTLRAENVRLESNQQALMDKADYYQTQAGKSAASVQMLELTKSELEENYDKVCQTAKELDVKLKRIKAASTTESNTQLFISTVVKDSIIYKDGATDTCKVLDWKDPWVSVDGELRNGNITLSVFSVDTLIQVIHRVPKRFLFFKFGTKAVRQTITSSNPHTKITYTEYMELR